MAMQRQVWSIWVRISHWLVAICVVSEWLNETGYWHRSLGYLCVSIVAMRLVYGMCTNSAGARFYSPNWHHICMHWNAIVNNDHADHKGHNPWSQWAVYLMWSLIVLLAVTGFISRTDAYWCEDLPINMHKLFSNALMALVLLHLLEVWLMSYITKRNLVQQMLSGQATILGNKKMTSQDYVTSQNARRKNEARQK
jgi:cytochrome b